MFFSFIKYLGDVITEISLMSLLLCPLTGGRVKTWKRRWFILTDNCLYYFEYTTVSKATPMVINSDITIESKNEINGLLKMSH